MKIDKNTIKELTDYLNEFNLTEIEYTDKDTKIKVSKSNSASSSQELVLHNLHQCPYKKNPRLHLVLKLNLLS